MGNNLNLVSMLGVPQHLTCPLCSNQGTSDFDDYDIDCGDPFPAAGQLALDCRCQKCDHAWVWRARLAFIQDARLPPPLGCNVLRNIRNRALVLQSLCDIACLCEIGCEIEGAQSAGTQVIFEQVMEKVKEQVRAIQSLLGKEGPSL